MKKSEENELGQSFTLERSPAKEKSAGSFAQNILTDLKVPETQPKPFEHSIDPTLKDKWACHMAHIHAMEPAAFLWKQVRRDPVQIQK